MTNKMELIAQVLTNSHVTKVHQHPELFVAITWILSITAIILSIISLIKSKKKPQ